MDIQELISRFGVALGIGLLIGIERGWRARRSASRQPHRWRAHLRDHRPARGRDRCPGAGARRRHRAWGTGAGPRLCRLCGRVRHLLPRREPLPEHLLGHHRRRRHGDVRARGLCADRRPAHRRRRRGRDRGAAGHAGGPARLGRTDHLAGAALRAGAAGDDLHRPADRARRGDRPVRRRQSAPGVDDRHRARRRVFPRLRAGEIFRRQPWGAAGGGGRRPRLLDRRHGGLCAPRRRGRRRAAPAGGRRLARQRDLLRSGDHPDRRAEPRAPARDGRALDCRHAGRRRSCGGGGLLAARSGRRAKGRRVPQPVQPGLGDRVRRAAGRDHRGGARARRAGGRDRRHHRRGRHGPRRRGRRHCRHGAACARTLGGRERESSPSWWRSPATWRPSSRSAQRSGAAALPSSSPSCRSRRSSRPPSPRGRRFPLPLPPRQAAVGRRGARH